jgi:hypothetical protein
MLAGILQISYESESSLFCKYARFEEAWLSALKRSTHGQKYEYRLVKESRAIASLVIGNT